MEIAIAAAAMVGCLLGCTAGMALLMKLGGRFRAHSREQSQ
jgi:uncharacterized integral membrane protein